MLSQPPSFPGGEAKFLPRKQCFYSPNVLISISYAKVLCCVVLVVAAAVGGDINKHLFTTDRAVMIDQRISPKSSMVNQ